jgi:hypothetical protein
MCSGRDRVPVGQRGQFAIVPPMGRTQLASEHTDSNQRVIIAMLASIDAGEFTAATDHFTDDITIILGNSEPLVGVLAFIRRSKEFTGSFQSGAGQASRWLRQPRPGHVVRGMPAGEGDGFCPCHPLKTPSGATTRARSASRGQPDVPPRLTESTTAILDGFGGVPD